MATSLRLALLLVGLALAGGISFGCGSSSSDDQAALEQARKEGAQAARQNQRIRELERKVSKARKDQKSEASTTVPSASSSSDASSYVPTYVPYSPAESGYSYSAEVPSGGGWSSASESHPTAGNLLRTSLRGPDGTLLIIDYTPEDVPSLGGSYDAVDSSLQTNFGTATKYLFSTSQSLPDCSGRPCADFLINDGAGGGWGVLGGGPSLPVAESIASHVAQSISYGE